jgi:hypothetical protein
VTDVLAQVGNRRPRDVVRLAQPVVATVASQRVEQGRHGCRIEPALDAGVG